MLVRPRTVPSRIGLALLGIALLAGIPRGGRAEPDEPPVVTLDALPLGVPLDRLDDGARARVDAIQPHETVVGEIAC
jgi:hypothetical protein